MANAVAPTLQCRGLPPTPHPPRFPHCLIFRLLRQSTRPIMAEQQTPSLGLHVPAAELLPAFKVAVHATHFRRVVAPDHMDLTKSREYFMPCAPGDHGARNIRLQDIALDDLLVKETFGRGTELLQEPPLLAPKPKESELDALKRQVRILQERLRECIRRLSVYEYAGGFDLLAPKIEALLKTLEKEAKKNEVAASKLDFLAGMIEDAGAWDPRGTLAHWRKDFECHDSDSEL